MLPNRQTHYYFPSYRLRFLSWYSSFGAIRFDLTFEITSWGCWVSVYLRPSLLVFGILCRDYRLSLLFNSPWVVSFSSLFLHLDKRRGIVIWGRAWEWLVVYLVRLSSWFVAGERFGVWFFFSLQIQVDGVVVALLLTDKHSYTRHLG